MRLAIENKISRDEFLKYYIGNEINPKFEIFKRKLCLEIIFKKYKKDFAEMQISWLSKKWLTVVNQKL